MKNKIYPTYSSTYSNITIRSSDLKSKNLIVELYSLVNPKKLNKKSLPKLNLTEVVADKQNGGLQILLYADDLYKYYLLSVDENLQVLYVSEFGLKAGNDAFRITDKDFYLYTDGEQKSYGTHQAGYVKTPIDFALSQEGLNFNTVLEFDDYQLLFIDNSKKKSTMVYRIEN